MPLFRLVIPQVFFQEMLDHARAVLPRECCGLLAGRMDDGIGQVQSHHPLVNELASPIAFRSEARSLFAAMKAMRASETEILAIYHSHPASAPIPSRSDLAQNYSEQVMNLIFGFASNPPEVRGWWLTATSFVPAEWEIL